MRLSNAIAIGTVINHASQAGGDDETLRNVALGIREVLDPSERAAFTEAIEMCGLLLDEPTWHRESVA